MNHHGSTLTNRRPLENLFQQHQNQITVRLDLLSQSVNKVLKTLKSPLVVTDFENEQEEVEPTGESKEITAQSNQIGDSATFSAIEERLIKLEQVQQDQANTINEHAAEHKKLILSMQKQNSDNV